MVRFDMSEFQERHTVSRLVGAPPGLRRLRGGGPAHRGGAPQAVLRAPLRRDREGAPRRLQHPAPDPRRRPAHRRAGPHGRLQEHGRDHDLATSAPTASRQHARREESFDELKDELMELLRAQLPARVHQPDRRDHRLPRTRPRSSSPRSPGCCSTGWRGGCAHSAIEVEFTDEAVALLAHEGFDPEFGARPLRRTIQRLVENELSRHGPRRARSIPATG